MYGRAGCGPDRGAEYRDQYRQPSAAPVCRKVCGAPPAAPAASFAMAITFSGENARPIPHPINIVATARIVVTSPRPCAAALMKP